MVTQKDFDSVVDLRLTVEQSIAMIVAVIRNHGLDNISFCGSASTWYRSFRYGLFFYNDNTGSSQCEKMLSYDVDAVCKRIIERNTNNTHNRVKSVINADSKICEQGWL